MATSKPAQPPPRPGVMATSSPLQPPPRPGVMTTSSPLQPPPRPQTAIHGSSSSIRPRLGPLGLRPPWSRRDKAKNASSASNQEAVENQNDGVKTDQNADHVVINMNDSGVLGAPKPVESDGKKTDSSDNAKADYAATAVNQQIEDPKVLRCTWTIDDLSNVSKKLYSDIFIVGGCKWRVLIFPKGNNVEFLSLYLDAVDLTEFPYGWSAKFSLSVVNQIQNKYTVRKDIELDVKGCKDIYASFDKYVETDHLEEYDAGKHGSQVNDRCEFPLQLDLDRDDRKYLSSQADRGVRNLYTLYSVIVHIGDTGRGHYYAFIRPTLSDQWFKFDDERVTKVDASTALQEQYGGEELFDTPSFNSTPNFIEHSSAYILVYIRESDKDKIMFNVDERKMADYLQIRLDMDPEEEQKADTHLYTNIKVVLDDHLEAQIGKSIFFDLVNHDSIPSICVQEHMPFTQFKDQVAEELGIPVQFQRFWLWAKRQNHTCRLSRPLNSQEEELTVGKLSKAADKANAELKLFLEVERGLVIGSSLPMHFPVLNFLYLFPQAGWKEEEKERTKSTESYVGRLYVKASEKPPDILPKLRAMAGFSHEEVELYEEIKFEPLVMCEYIDNSVNFQSCKLQDGDIVCFQKMLKPDTAKLYRYPDVASFLVYIRNRKVLHLRPLEKPDEDGFCVEASMVSTYDEVVDRVAKILHVDQPSIIQLRSHDCYSHLPEPQPIKCRGTECVQDILHNQTSDILYYEVLDVPIVSLVVAYHHATKDQVSLHSIRLPGSSTVGDVLSDIKSKVELSHPNAEIRLLEVFYHKIYKIFTPDDKIENISYQYWTLRAEEREQYKAWEQYLGLEHQEMPYQNRSAADGAQIEIHGWVE
ncbi:hypothetical protein ACQ4PT_015296 [Festuca glaucescens]